MSAARRTAKSLLEVLQASLQILILYLLTSEVLGAEMCTKAVPVQREPSKKVHVLRRVPASCSNWEKAWSWITKKDCGTKYRLDLVDLPSHKMVTYRIKKVCCEGDTRCKDAEANGLAASGVGVSDEKFLAIVLGSTAAALFVLILVISISLCRKKKQCTLLCEERRHIYASAEDADESSELQGQKGCGVDEEETENKVCESEYAEINDSGLPRYTDIFKEAGAPVDDDPFTRATAPPITSYESRAACAEAQCERGRGLPDAEGRGRLDSERRGRAESEGRGDPDESNVKEVLQGTADILERELWLKQRRESEGPAGAVAPDPDDDGDTDYYNVAAGQQGQGQRQGQCQGQGSAVVAASASASASVREEAVLSLTKDDPAVLTGGARTSLPTSSSSSSPPSPSSHSPGRLPRPNADSASCDVNGEAGKAGPPPTPPPPPQTTAATGATTKPAPREEKCSSSSASAYESLAQHGDRDGHEYQRLIRRKGSANDTEANVVGEDLEEEEEELGFVDDESAAAAVVVVNGHAEAAADC